MKKDSPQRTFLKVPYWSQDKNHYTCGPICIRMVLSFLEGKRLNKKEYLQILESTMNGDPTKESGTSELKFKRAIKERGCKYRTIYGENGIAKALESKHPAIVSCWMTDEYGDRYRHYIIVTGRDDKYFYINDPSNGKSGKIQKKIFMARAQKLNWGVTQGGIEVYRD
jgi:predicted double-glycine peptidase